MTPPDGVAGRETQRERTRLAWRRTSLAFLVAVLLAWRGAVVLGGGVRYTGAVLVCLAWAGFLALAHRRIAALAAAGAPGPARPPGPAEVLGATGTVLAVCAVWLVWLVLLR
ncbi:DUF202 domain-containing protein [Streptomyces aidingensis]|uniref:DUF202 domain-containing protein n=1 Tax=Streptomyces aidingensis TaxID=910347 RepID=A0A1I1U660_9ACTN|nr:DUF202 domain-containing protein [Streptomyces aidingensis]SFD66322.1 hypothetical protein SAMN05421773_1238 [Streptomyces aidingensis]